MVNELIELPLCFIIRYLYGGMNWLVSPINSRNLADSIYVSAACLSLPPVSHTLTLPKPVSLLHSNLLAKPLHLPLQGHLPQAPVNHLQERLLGFSSNCIQFPKCCSTIITTLVTIIRKQLKFSIRHTKFGTLTSFRCQWWIFGTISSSNFETE